MIICGVFGNEKDRLKPAGGYESAFRVIRGSTADVPDVVSMDSDFKAKLCKSVVGDVYPSETPVSRSILILKTITSGDEPSAAITDSTGVSIGNLRRSLDRTSARWPALVTSSNVPKAMALLQHKSLSITST